MVEYVWKRRRIMSREAAVVIANAIIWGTVVVGSAMALRGTGAFSDIQLIRTFRGETPAGYRPPRPGSGQFLTPLVEA
jgi:hypothetical protein